MYLAGSLRAASYKTSNLGSNVFLSIVRFILAMSSVIRGQMVYSIPSFLFITHQQLIDREIITECNELGMMRLLLLSYSQAALLYLLE